MDDIRWGGDGTAAALRETRDGLVRLLRETPGASPAALSFADELAAIDDPGELATVFQFLADRSQPGPEPGHPEAAHDGPG